MQEHRKDHRYARNPRAVIITEDNGKQVKIHGKTHDISLGGVSIISEANLLTPHPVTLCLLVHPGDPPLIFEARSKIVSNVFSRQQGGFRIAFQFVMMAGNGEQLLREYLATKPVADGYFAH